MWLGETLPQPIKAYFIIITCQLKTDIPKAEAQCTAFGIRPGITFFASDAAYIKLDFGDLDLDLFAKLCGTGNAVDDGLVVDYLA